MTEEEKLFTEKEFEFQLDLAREEFNKSHPELDKLDRNLAGIFALGYLQAIADYLPLGKLKIALSIGELYTKGAEAFFKTKY